MFNSTNGGYSLSDIAAVTGANNGGFFGGDGAGNGWWIILLFLVFGGWNGNGWGNNGGAGSDDISYNFDISGLDNGIRGLTSDTAAGFYGLNTSLLTSNATTATNMLNGFAGVNAAICDANNDILMAINGNTVAGMQNTNALTSIMAQHSADEQLCCCQTQNLINSKFADLNYNLASQECDTRRAVQDAERDLIENANNNTRQILDFLVQDRLSALQSENSALKTQLSQDAQNEYLLSQLRPVANPAYVVANPYTGQVYPNYGFNGYGYNYCGCGCNA